MARNDLWHLDDGLLSGTPVGVQVTGNMFIGATNETSGACTNCNTAYNNP